MSGDGIFGAIKDGFRARNDRKAAKRNAKDARANRDAGMSLVGDLDWEPEYESEHIAPYQRSQSPVARGFLESFLTGSNPAAVQSTRAGAPQARAQAQTAFNQNYGGWDELRAQQQEMQQSTPWAVKPFDRKVVPDAQRERTKAPGLEQFGLTLADAEALKKVDVNLDLASGNEQYGWVSKRRRDKESMARAYKAIADAVNAGDMNRAKAIRNGAIWIA